MDSQKHHKPLLFKKSSIIDVDGDSCDDDVKIVRVIEKRRSFPIPRASSPRKEQLLQKRERRQYHDGFYNGEVLSHSKPMHYYENDDKINPRISHYPPEYQTTTNSQKSTFQNNYPFQPCYQQNTFLNKQNNSFQQPYNCREQFQRQTSTQYYDSYVREPTSFHSYVQNPLSIGQSLRDYTHKPNIYEYHNTKYITPFSNINNKNNDTYITTERDQLRDYPSRRDSSSPSSGKSDHFQQYPPINRNSSSSGIETINYKHTVPERRQYGVRFEENEQQKKLQRESEDKIENGQLFYVNSEITNSIDIPEKISIVEEKQETVNPPLLVSNIVNSQEVKEIQQRVENEEILKPIKRNEETHIAVPKVKQKKEAKQENKINKYVLNKNENKARTESDENEIKHKFSLIKNEIERSKYFDFEIEEEIDSRLNEDSETIEMDITAEEELPQQELYESSYQRLEILLKTIHPIIQKDKSRKYSVMIVYYLLRFGENINDWNCGKDFIIFDRNNLQKLVVDTFLNDKSLDLNIRNSVLLFRKINRCLRNVKMNKFIVPIELENLYRTSQWKLADDLRLIIQISKHGVGVYDLYLSDFYIDFSLGIKLQLSLLFFVV